MIARLIQDARRRGVRAVDRTLAPHWSIMITGRSSVFSCEYYCPIATPSRCWGVAFEREPWLRHLIAPYRVPAMASCKGI